LEKLRKMAEEACQHEGCLLYDLEFTGGTQNRVLRVFVDKEKDTVSVDDCANVSRGLNLLLDVEDLISDGAYELEVSSPGVDRRLSETWHFQKVVGQWVRISTTSPISIPEEEKAKLSRQAPMSIEGVLVEAEDQMVIVKKKEVNWKVPRDIICQAKVLFDFEANCGKKEKEKKKKKRKR